MALNSQMQSKFSFLTLNERAMSRTYRKWRILGIEEAIDMADLLEEGEEKIFKRWRYWRKDEMPPCSLNKSGWDEARERVADVGGVHVLDFELRAWIREDGLRIPENIRANPRNFG